MNTRKFLMGLFELGIIPSKNTLTFIKTDIQGVQRLQSEKSQAQVTTNQSGSNYDDKKLDASLNNFQDSLKKVAVRGPASYLGALQVQDEFRFETSPALAVMANTMSDYTGIIANAMRKSEEFVLQTSQTVSGGIATLAAGLAGLGLATAILGPIGGIGAAATLLGRFLIRRLGINILGTLPGVARVSRVVAPAVKPVRNFLGQALTAVGEFFLFKQLNSIVYSIVDRLTKSKQQNIFQTSLAAGMIQPNLLQEYFLQTRGIRGYSREDFKQLQDATARYGATNSQLYDVLNTIETSLPRFESRNSFASAVVNTSNFLGVDSSVIANIYSNLGAVLGAGKPNGAKVRPVTRAFESFYLSLSNSVNPSLVNVSLVDSLSSFARSYVMGKKLVMDTEELAAIQSFVSRSSIGDKVTTEVTRNVIGGLDNILLEYATFGNPNAATLARSSGITIEEAARGVTADADVFERLLRGISSRFGIDDGDMSDEQFGNMMFYLTNSDYTGLGMSFEDAQATAELVRSLNSGNKITRKDLNRVFKVPHLDEEGNMKEFNIPVDTSDGVSLAERVELDKLYKPLKLLEGLSQGEFRLWQTNVENIGVAVDLTRGINDGFTNKMVDILGSFAALAATAVNTIDEIQNDKGFFGKVGQGIYGYFVNAGSDVVDASLNLGYVIQEGVLTPIKPLLTPEEGEVESPHVQTAQRIITDVRGVKKANVNKRAERDIAQQLYGLDALPKANFITGEFNEVYELRGKAPYRHKGIDIDLGAGANIFTTMAGTVVIANSKPKHKSGYGKFVVVKDEYGFHHYYSHLSSVTVRQGQTVIQGQKIGRQGNTGTSTGSHLHYEVRGPDNSVDGRMDPVLYFEMLEIVNHTLDWWDEDNLEFRLSISNPAELAEEAQDRYTKKDIVQRMHETNYKQSR